MSERIVSGQSDACESQPERTSQVRSLPPIDLGPAERNIRDNPGQSKPDLNPICDVSSGESQSRSRDIDPNSTRTVRVSCGGRRVAIVPGSLASVDLQVWRDPVSRLHAAIELLRDTAEDQLRGELIDAVLAAAMTWRTGGYGGGSIWARQPLPPIVAELAASLTPDLCDREGCCQTAAPGAWRLLGAELHSGVRLEVRLCPACAVELARRGASARASAGELTPAPASVERGSTSPPCP